MDEELIELEEIVDETIIDFEESIGWIAGDNTRHDSLVGRNDSNQHEIKAIEGLSEELESLKSLEQSVYSNKLGVANYYKCIDGPYDGHGYFVAMANADTVKKCNGNNNDAIFGVTVSDAAFIGGQFDVVANNLDGSSTHTLVVATDEVLVATTGLVIVRCMTDVAIGDFVVANADGVARKTDTNSGYKVIDTHTDDSLTYASIMLGVQADVADKLAASVNDLDQRVDIVETQIIEAINRIDQIDSSKLVTSDKIEGIEESIDSIVSSQDSMASEITNASTIAQQAKTISESAIASAISIKNEALDSAREAIQEAHDLRDEFANTSQAIQDGIDEVMLDFNELANDLTPLSEWGDGKGIAGFVARADEDAVTLASVTKLEGDFGTSLAGFVSSATSENAEIKALAQYNGKAAGLIADVQETKAEIELIAKGEGSIAGLKNLVDETKAQTEIISQKIESRYEKVSSFAQADKTKHNVIYYAEDTKKYHYWEHNEWKETTDPSTAGLIVALAGVKVKSDENSSSINNLTSWQGTTKDTMARLEQKADETGAYMQSTVSSLDKYAVGPHSQAYGFTLEDATNILVEGMIYVPIENMTIGNNKAETYSYTESGEQKIYTQEFYKGFLYRWSKIGSQYKWIAVDKNYTETEINASGMSVYFYDEAPVTVDTTHGYWYKTKDTLDEYEVGTLYKWSSYTTINDEEETVTEYRWFPVATLAGNSQSRAVSQIRQDANSIGLSITDIRGSVTGLDARISDTESNIQTLTSWTTDTDGNQYNLATIKQTADSAGARIAQVVESVGKDGNVTAASIVTAVTGDASAISMLADNITVDATQVNFDVEDFEIDASKINFETTDFEIDASHIINLEAPEIYLDGYVTFTNLEENNGTTFINGANIFTDSLSAISANLGSVTSGHIQSPHYGEALAWEVTPSSPTPTPSSGLSYLIDRDFYELIGRGTCTDLDVVIPSTYEGWPVTIIGNSVFSGCTDLVSITIPNSITSIGNKAFYNCTSLTDVYYYGTEAEWNEISMGTDNSSLTSATIHYISPAPQGLICTAIDGGAAYEVKSDNTIGAEVIIPSTYNGKPVTSIGAYAFNMRGGLTNIIIPDSITNIGDGAFYSCSGLTSITIPDSVTTVGNYVFQNCSSLKNVVIGNGITVIPSLAFYGCTQLDNIIIPNGVTRISNQAFENCTSLKSIIIPNSVNYIAQKAFNGCTNFRVYYGGTQSDWENIPVNGAGITNDTIYYYSATHPATEGNYWHEPGFRISCDDTYMIDSHYFKVKQDGSMYTGDITARNGKFSNCVMDDTCVVKGELSGATGTFRGEVSASSGDIGNLQIAGGGLSYGDDYSLNHLGLTISNENARIKVGNLSIYNNTSSNTAILNTEGAFKIAGTNDTAIELMRNDGATESQDLSLDLYAKNKNGKVALLLSANISGHTSWNRAIVEVPYIDLGYNGSSPIYSTWRFEFEAGNGSSKEVIYTSPNGYGALVVSRGGSTFGDEVVIFAAADDHSSGWTKQLSDVVKISQTRCPGEIVITGNLMPSINQQYTIGASSGNKWAALYVNDISASGLINGVVVGNSDRNKKNTIQPLVNVHEQIFDALQPVSYKFNDSTDDCVHTGFIAQDVKAAVENVGMPIKDFAAYCEWKDDDGTTSCGLKYSEFIALCVDQIQKLKTRVVELEEQNVTLEERLTKIEALLNATK